MKRGTPGHPKTLMLASFLDLPRYAAIGLMEGLWHFAAQYAQQGDIGKYTPKVIAGQLDWRGDAELLMKSFIDSKLVDVLNEQVRYIHDWHEHCEDYVDKQLAYHGLCYANGSPTRRQPNGLSDKVGESRTMSAKVGQSRRKSDNVGHCQTMSANVCLPKALSLKPILIPPIVPKGEKVSECGSIGVSELGGKSEYSEGFLKFWKVYPRKKDKMKAWRYWEKHKCEKIVDLIVGSVEEHRKLKDWKKDDGEFIPYPGSFINAHGWEDEVENKKNGEDPRGRRFGGKE